MSLGPVVLGGLKTDVLARMSDAVLPYKKGTNVTQHALSVWPPTPCLKSLLSALKLAIVVDCAILPIWSRWASTLLHKAWAPCILWNTTGNELLLEPGVCSRVQYPHDSSPVSQGLRPWMCRLDAPSSPCSRRPFPQGPAVPSSPPFLPHQYSVCLR